MAFIVRSSKYRHVFGTASKRESCFENLHLSISAFDTNYVTANPKYISVNWNSGGGGAFCVVPHEEAGKLRGDFPIFAAHAGAVLDTAFSPFDDDVIASGAEDHQAMVWRVPSDLLEREEDVTEPLVTLGGHGRKVGHVAWNPVASDVLAVASSDYTVRLWDVQQKKSMVTLQGFKDAVLSIDWSADGRSMAVAARDKKLRLFDTRSGECVQQGDSHQGIKGSRVTWLTGDRLATTGFTRSSYRQLFLWNAQDLSKPLATYDLDMSAGMLMPFYDPSTRMLYVGGKGDGNIRYYEFADDQLHELSMYSSSEPQRGLGVMPKRGVDVAHCEIMRFFKVASNSLVEPISFRVPRKSEAFQQDIYPPAFAGVPAMTAQEFFAGKNAEPRLVDMEQLFRDGPLVVGAAAGSAPATVAAPVPAPAAVSAPAPVKAPSPEPVSVPAKTPSPAPPPAKTPSPEPAAAARSATPPPSTPRSTVSDIELTTLRETNQQLQHQLEQATQATATAQSAAHSASSQLLASKHSVVQLQDQLTKTQLDVDSLRSELAEALAKVEAEQGEATRARDEAVRAEQMVAEYREKLQKAEESLQKMENDRESIREELAQAISAANALASAAEKAADAM
ncbi:Coronin-like protein crn1 [Coemansia sp. RSA 1722]|nr:Coronin-like protein crn1 [Coemansia sp. RSA 485]KAJ2604614.1 Coronin-like protein crn1 [Coemansia sp. RSA 1722]KAJ2637371.1 Coronin-like protein crn1 [Coemansia sp. RSA 1286]